MSRPRSRFRLPPAAFHPATWLAAFLAWFATLWWLSSSSHAMRQVPPIQFLDKVLHFGWFMGGAGLLGAFLFRLRPRSRRTAQAAVFSVVLLAATGALDEWHQSQVPGRDGNNLADWAADIAGSISGILIFLRVGRPLLTPPCRSLAAAHDDPN